MPQERVTVVFTGQSGLDKRSLVRGLKLLAESRGHRVGLFSVGEMMYQISRAQRGRILQLPLGYLELARSQAFEQIRSYVDGHPGDDVYIDTHATFRWEGGLFPGFSVDEIAAIRPDVCVCFVADVDYIKGRLAYSDFPLSLSLRDIMVWREEEVLGGGLIAGMARCPHYVVPRRMRTEALYRLVHDLESRKLYISFPISRGLPKFVDAQIRDFRTRFQTLENYVIFDPLELTEEPRLLGALARAAKGEAKTIEVESSGRRVHLDTQELREIKRYVEGWTRSADYRMVDQTDATVALIPEHEGDPFRADGVFMEIAYAQQKAKATYLIWPADESPSLMINPDRVFSTVDEAVEFFA